MTSFKTTLAGLTAVLAGAVYLSNALFGIVAPEITSPAAAVAAIAAGVGLIFGRDNDVTDEEAAKK